MLTFLTILIRSLHIGIRLLSPPIILDVLQMNMGCHFNNINFFYNYKNRYKMKYILEPLIFISNSKIVVI